jgi:NAD(P)H-dependent FMN reductase
MKKILVVIGSARQGRAADKIAKFIAEELTAFDAEPVMADLGAINLPFFNSPIAPAAEGYAITNDVVQAWSKMVKESDGVVLLTPEYNLGTSAILKNSIDWLYTEWAQKPVTVIGYGWSGAASAITDVVKSMNHVKASVQEDTASLFFMKSIGVDGEPMKDEAKLMTDPVLKALVG